VDATVTLTAVERRRGIKAVVVRLSPTRALVMESRRALRNDAVTSDTRVPPEEGVLVYVVDTAIDTLHGPIRVLARDRESGRGDKSRAPLGPGESLTYAGITVTVVSAQAIHDTVTVEGVPQGG
jgi:hypothetical protein